MIPGNAKFLEFDIATMNSAQIRRALENHAWSDDPASDVVIDRDVMRKLIDGNEVSPHDERDHMVGSAKDIARYIRIHSWDRSIRVFAR